MKIVLTKDVRDMGRKGSVIDVAPGHAINFLFPRKLAIPATAKNVQDAAQLQKHAEGMKEVDAALLKQNIESLNDARVVIVMKANDKGHLYDAVAAQEIVAAAKGLGIAIPEEAIKLDKPIKEVGEHEVPVSFGETFGSFKVIIEPEA